MGALCEDVSFGMSVQGTFWVELQWVTFSLDVSCFLEPTNNEAAT